MKISVSTLCGFAVGALGAFCRPAAAQPPPAADRVLAREILEELVEIPTTQADGTARAAQVTAARLVAAGFPQGDVHIIASDENVANVVARFRGRNPRARPACC